MLASPQRFVLVIGLESSGKSSILNKIRILRHSMTLPLTPTIGQNLFKTRYKKLEVTFWDLGGSERIRDTWNHYYEEANLIYYVIDLSRPDQLAESLKILLHIIKDTEEAKTPFCIILNKKDAPGACSPENFITEHMNEEIIPTLLRQGNVYLIVPTTASEGNYVDPNIDQMMEWSVEKLRKQIQNTKATQIEVIDV